MLATQLVSDELVSQVLSDVQARDQPIVGRAWPTVCRSSEIKIGEGHKVLNSPATSDSKAFYVVIIIGLSAILCGFAWINLRLYRHCHLDRRRRLYRWEPLILNFRLFQRAQNKVPPRLLPRRSTPKKEIAFRVQTPLLARPAGMRLPKY